MELIIKFRAWHKGYPGTNINPQMLYDEKPGDCLTYLNHGQPVEVMQYTGLKDKNGKEIYEGDVLSGSTSDCVYKVVWNIGKARFQKIGIWKGNTYFESIDELSYVSVRECEVIGNIHANPELIQS